MMRPAFSCYGDYSNSNYGIHCLAFNDPAGNTFYFSYKTLIAFQHRYDPVVISKNYWSRTTGKHLNAIDPDKSKRVDHETFERKYQEAFGETIK